MRYITRTIKSMQVITKVYNETTDAIEDATFTISNVPEPKVEREVTKLLKETSLKLIKIIGTFETEAKYKMTEADFIANAEIVTE